MAIEDLTSSEIDLILESLNYTKRAFENYQYYPSYQFKLDRIAEVDRIRSKILEARRGKKGRQNEDQAI